MSNKSNSVPAAPQPEPIGSLPWLGSSPLLPGENAADYDLLLERVSAAVRPSDELEEIWLRDVVDLTWDVFRWRRMKDSLIGAHCHEGLLAILDTLLPPNQSNVYAMGWARRDPSSVEKIHEVLADCGLSIDAALAETLMRLIDPIERINRLITTAESRRNVALREIDRHRAAFASVARRAVQNVEDAEFHMVERDKDGQGDGA